MYYLHPYGGEYEQEFGEKGVEDVERLLQEGIVKVFIEDVYVASKEKYLTNESYLTVLEYFRDYFDDYKIGLLDATYGIIDNGGKAEVYHQDGKKTSPIIIKNDIGIAVVLPVNYNAEDFQNDGKVVIEVEVA